MLFFVFSIERDAASGADQINAAVHNVSKMTGKSREAIDKYPIKQ
jgi:hypothetical protein